MNSLENVPPYQPKPSVHVPAIPTSYIGGSLNFASLASALAVPSGSLAGAMAVDNLAMAAFLAGGVG